jgi:hypothetical protein
MKRFHSRVTRAGHVAAGAPGGELAELWERGFVDAIHRSERVLMRVYRVTEADLWRSAGPVAEAAGGG